MSPARVDPGLFRDAVDVSPEALAIIDRDLAELGGLDVDRLCDRLLERVVIGRTDDDIALLAVRCGPVPCL